MSTTSTTSSTISSSGLTSGSTLTDNGAGGALQITGLGSGLNTNEIIQAELAVQEQPLTNMQNEISGLKTEDSTLSGIQNDLQVVSLDAQLLAEPSTFFDTQTITSSNSSLVTAQTTDGVGVPVGSSTLTVSQLAAAAQTAFTYTPPASGPDTLSISDGVDAAQTITVAAGTTTQALAEQINGSNSLDVYAAVSSAGALVLSSRHTGSQYTVSATDQTNPSNLTQGAVTAGQDAEYTLNGVAGSSASDTVTGAIPGVTLTLQGVTGTSDPITITAQQPGPNTSSIVSAVTEFINDYNTAISAIEAAVNTEPASASDPTSYNPNSGSLFGDPELENLLSDMRDSMISGGSGLSAGMAAMTDLGISTGSSTGEATLQGVDGDLSLDAATLESALETDPGGVQSVITQWAQGFQTVVNHQAGPGGAMADRVSGNTSLASELQTQYESMQANFTEQEQNMEEEWAQVEATMTDLKSDSTYLDQISSESFSSSSNSSSS